MDLDEITSKRYVKDAENKKDKLTHLSNVI